MSKIVWDQTGARFFETGVRKGVLYPQDTSGTYPLGVPWNGLSKMTESPSGAEASAIYADDIKYLNLMSAEEFGGTIEAYTYPAEFGACDGSKAIATGVMAGQQPRKAFGFSYVTVLGNDTDGNDHGYKLHLVYGALAAPSEKSYESVNDSPKPNAFSWKITTTPVSVTGIKPTACLTIDSTKVDKDKLAALETVLYGADGVDPRLPLPDEVVALVGEGTISALSMTSVPMDKATAVLTTANVVLTFNNKMVKASVVVSSAAGVKIAGTASFDSTQKILTFHPTTALSSSTTYLVVVSGAVDVYSQALADTVETFTTAS